METVATKKIIKEVLLDASASRVWKAITQPAQLKEWYATVNDMKPEVGFEFTFTTKDLKGEPKIHLCRITQVENGKKLQYVWAYKNHPGESLVTFELTPEGNKTWLKLTHEGVHSFAQNGPGFLLENFSNGWSHLLENLLVAYLNK